MVIQFRQVMDNFKNPTQKDLEELAMTLQLLNDNNIEYDIEAPKQFKEWKKEGNRTFLIWEDVRD